MAGIDLVATVKEFLDNRGFKDYELCPPGFFAQDTGG